MAHEAGDLLAPVPAVLLEVSRKIAMDTVPDKGNVDPTLTHPTGTMTDPLAGESSLPGVRFCLALAFSESPSSLLQASKRSRKRRVNYVLEAVTACS